MLCFLHTLLFIIFYLFPLHYLFLKYYTITARERDQYEVLWSRVQQRLYFTQILKFYENFEIF